MTSDSFIDQLSTDYLLIIHLKNNRECAVLTGIAIVATDLYDDKVTKKKALICVNSFNIHPYEQKALPATGCMGHTEGTYWVTSEG